jgi:hypothetical protein
VGGKNWNDRLRYQMLTLEWPKTRLVVLLYSARGNEHLPANNHRLYEYANITDEVLPTLKRK